MRAACSEKDRNMITIFLKYCIKLKLRRLILLLKPYEDLSSWLDRQHHLHQPQWVYQVSSFPFQQEGTCVFILLPISHNYIFYDFFNCSRCCKRHLSLVIQSLLSIPLLVFFPRNNFERRRNLVSRISLSMYVLDWLGCSCYTKLVTM